ncbi:MAG TPA: permease prefix domain 1-containing protein, partial [Acidothermaceae bacterium]
MFTELLNDLRYRLRALFRRSDVERELDDELRDHVEREAAANRAAGIAPEDAMRRARIAFGGMANVRERSRDGRGIRWLEIIARDLRLAGRSLRRDAGFTAIAVLSLAIGICMSAGVVTMLQSVYSGGLSFRNIDGVVALYRPTSGSLSSRRYDFTGPAIRSLIERSTQLRDAALLHSKALSLRTDSSDSWISGAEATPTLFSMLGARPEIGRLFGSEDGLP